jgi:hypothetical protein
VQQLSGAEAHLGLLSFGTAEQAAENSETQIPRELKLARNDKNKRVAKAHRKVRPFKTTATEFFSSL